jgi:polyribonucleotide nucleotidyltransferase
MTDFVATLPEEEAGEKEGLIRSYYHEVEALAVRNQVLDNGLRLDGRKTDEIRPIWSEVDLLPGPHGCALFTRGETQSLTTVTLGSKMDSNRIDAATKIGDEKFYLHYNFPPFSTGEARMMRGTSRREIGHGNLAQRALKRMVPASSGYTIRVVSEILESNGSSSMATVCAGSMAMMDAGLEIIRPVSGIAMGLITDQKTGKFAVLSDILGDEDHLGDMDFKVTGTEKGITACQMDIKVKGLSYEILETALMQANAGRKHIGEEMAKTIDAPRKELKPHTPKMVVMEIPKEYIGGVIGPGGKIIQGIQADTNTTITLEEIEEVGRIEISGTDAVGLAKAQSIIKEICFVPEVGASYDGVVKGVQTFGVFVEIGRNKEGLLHVSEMAWERVEDPADLYKEGDKVTVKLIGTDKGKLRLSRKVLLEKPEGYVERPSRPRPDRSDRSDRKGRNDRRGRDNDRRGGDRRRDDRNNKPSNDKSSIDKPREDNRGARGSQSDERGNLGEEMKNSKPSED